MNRQERRRERKSGRQVQDALNTGFTLYQQGDLAAAEKCFRRALRDDPDHPDANRLLAELLLDNRHFDAAIALFQNLVRLRPGHFLSHYSLGNGYRLAGQADSAIRSYRVALTLHPEFAGALHGIGAALSLAEREAEAIAWLRRAVERQPDFAVAWQDLATALAVTGDLPKAEDAFKKAASLDPRLGNARRMLAALRRDRPAEDEVAALLALSSDPATPPASRIDMLFAVGKLSDQAGDAERAFSTFTKANILRRAAHAAAGIVYDRRKFSHGIDQLIATFDRSSFAASPFAGDPSEAPVFIVGMPRSGSSLFEQIAASHTQVTGAGEFTGIGDIARRLGPLPGTWKQADILAGAQKYLDGAAAKAGRAARIIDKMPDNIFHLGLVAALFPNARVIFCDRDQADICLSCFFQNFSAPLAFDTDLEDAAHRCAETARLAKHWQTVLPLRNMTMCYEEVVENLPAQARRLVAFLGLEWDEACLSFHRAARPVRTASWAQVRQPIYHDAIGKWRRYAQFLPASWRPPVAV
jgi:tetratricopeptide (TPR) repeat protein